MGQEAGDAYRELRAIQHRARLDEAPTQIDASAAASLAEAVQALWRHVLRKIRCPPRSPAARVAAP